MIHTHSLPLTYFRVSDSQLGQPEAMRLFCKDLLKNKSVVELRYTLPVASLIPSLPRWRWSLGTRLLCAHDLTFVGDCIYIRYGLCNVVPKLSISFLSLTVHIPQETESWVGYVLGNNAMYVCSD